MADGWSKRRRAIARAKARIVDEAVRYFFNKRGGSYEKLLLAVEALLRAKRSP